MPLTVIDQSKGNVTNGYRWTKKLNLFKLSLCPKICAFGKTGTEYIRFSKLKKLSIDLQNDQNNYNLQRIIRAMDEIINTDIRVKGSLVTTIASPLEASVVA